MGNATSPLRQAVGNNDVRGVRMILEEAGEGAADLINEDFTSDCLFSCNRSVHIPLHTALAANKMAMVELMLQHGADPNSSSRDGETTLHRAARQNNVVAARLLVPHGADVSAQDWRGRYPVHIAALSINSRMSGNVDVLRYLLEEAGKPDDISLQDAGGNTPLHVAAAHGNIASVRHLAERGADLQARNAKGQTARDCATGAVKEHFDGWR